MEQHNSTYLMAEALEIFSALSPENQRKAILYLVDLSIQAAAQSPVNASRAEAP